MDVPDSELRRVFELAMESPPAERAALLEKLHPGNTELHRRITVMIAAAEDDTFLTEPTLLQPSAATGGAASVDAESVGSRIGPYTLLKLIGEGGVGSVYLAEQETPVARQVAIKIIKLGMDTREVVARFEQERQALAILDHPNIARVIEAGATSTGRPYFVMDLVQGEPICEFCDKRNLSVEARLELFSQVCSAVQHAHTKGIIHRDIKPTNVLVSQTENAPVAKVIDFGIAKATAGKLTEKTLFTEHKQLIGTPEYMSPEQADGAADIDTRSDVYSLGALLYELLTGSTPFTGRELRSAAYVEIQRIIREVEPPKPSTRLSKSENTIATVAAQRQIQPRKLTTLVRGELDWIVMKSLEKDRERRYGTVNALLADVRRYLDGEVVQAAPPGAVYRFKKFVRKNRGVVTAMTAIAIALLIGAVGFAWQARRARVERDAALVARNDEKTSREQATARQRTAEEVSKFFSDQILDRGDPNRLSTTRPVTLREAIDLAAGQVEGTFKNDPLIRATIHMSLGRSYSGMGLRAAAIAQFTTALDERRAALGPDAPETLEAMHALATTYRQLGDAAHAEPLLKDLLAARRRTSGNDAVGTCGDMTALGMFYVLQGRPADALPLLQDAYAGQVKALGERNINTLQTMNGLTVAYANTGQLDLAIQTGERELRLLRETVGNDHPETTNTMGVLAALYVKQHRYAEAIPLYREADDTERRVLGEDHPDRIGTYLGLAQALADSGDTAGATHDFQDAIAIIRASKPIDRATLENANVKYANVLILTKQFPQAEAALSEAYPVLLQLYGPSNRRTHRSVESLVHLYEAWGKPDQAAEWKKRL